MNAPPEDFAALVARGKDLYRKDRFAESRDVFREAIALGEQSFGPDAVPLIDPLNWLAMALSEKDYGSPPPECVALHQRILAIAESATGPHSLPTASALYRLSLDLASDREAALAHRRRALQIALAKLGDGDWFVSEVRSALGMLLTEMGRPEEAIPLLLREAALADERGSEIARMVAHRFLGEAYLGARRWVEAVRSIETSLALADARPAGGGPFAESMRPWLEEAKRGELAGS